jgi:hypothetical protein
MNELGRFLLIAGAILLFIGALVLALPKAGLSLGKLPGDWSFNSGGLTCLVPLGTSIVLSIILTIALNLIARFFR